MPEQSRTWQGSISEQKEPFIKIVETDKEWSLLWMHAFAKPAPVVDFEKNVVACVFLGHSADWLYSISFGKPYIRGNVQVIPYGLAEIILELARPFKASGQYSMEVFARKQHYSVILEEDRSSGSHK